MIAAIATPIPTIPQVAIRRTRSRSGGERQAVKELWLKYARYAKIAAYPLFYLVCLAIFVSLTFPYDKLKEHLVVAFNTQQSATGGQQELQIEEMTSSWIFVSSLAMMTREMLCAASSARSRKIRCGDS